MRLAYGALARSLAASRLAPRRWGRAVLGAWGAAPLLRALARSFAASRLAPRRWGRGRPGSVGGCSALACAGSLARRFASRSSSVRGGPYWERGPLVRFPLGMSGALARSFAASRLAPRRWGRGRPGSAGLYPAATPILDERPIQTAEDHPRARGVSPPAGGGVQPTRRGGAERVRVRGPRRRRGPERRKQRECAADSPRRSRARRGERSAAQPRTRAPEVERVRSRLPEAEPSASG